MVVVVVYFYKNMIGKQIPTPVVGVEVLGVDAHLLACVCKRCVWGVHWNPEPSEPSPKPRP